VLALSFNEGSGATAHDTSGNANDGAITGASFAAAGKFASALAFDGVNDWVTVADAASLDLTGSLTVEAWVNPSATSGNWRSVLMKEDPSGLAYALYAHDGAPLAGGTNRPAGYVRVAGTDQAIRGVAAMPLNTWTHLAVTYGGGTIRYFVNGVQVASRALSGSIAATALPLRIGGNAPWGEFFAGLIDEVRVYNRALTAAEIQADMNQPIP